MLILGLDLLDLKSDGFARRAMNLDLSIQSLLIAKKILPHLWWYMDTVLLRVFSFVTSIFLPSISKLSLLISSGESVDGCQLSLCYITCQISCIAYFLMLLITSHAIIIVIHVFTYFNRTRFRKRLKTRDGITKPFRNKTQNTLRN